MMIGSKVFLIAAAISIVRLLEESIRVLVTVQGQRWSSPVASASLLALASHKTSDADFHLDSGLVAPACSSSYSCRATSTTRLSGPVHGSLHDRQAHLAGR